MLLFPSVIIPGIMFGSATVSIKAVKKARQEVPTIMILGEAHAPELAKALQQEEKIKIAPASDDYARQISEKKIRAAIEFPVNFETALSSGENTTVKIFTYDGEMKSGFAAGELERILREHRDGIVNRKLQERDLPPTFVRPFEIKRQNVAPPEKVGGNLVGGFIPYLLILVCFIGAMYPAIDLTAGEKERGTMETILCSPVGRVELVLGKFLTVLAVSLATVLVSVLSMAGSGIAMIAMFKGKVASAATAGAAASGGAMPMIDPLGVLAVCVMVLPLAVMFSAVLFATALYAKSHKEAQTYVSPFMIVIILPAVAAMLPGVELTKTLALVPILNVSLVSKEMVSGSFPWPSMALIFFSSCVYGAAALALAVAMFKRESVLFRT
jgi:sodium transport system permease protein